MLCVRGYSDSVASVLSFALSSVSFVLTVLCVRGYSDSVASVLSLFCAVISQSYSNSAVCTWLFRQCCISLKFVLRCRQSVLF